MKVPWKRRGKGRSIAQQQVSKARWDQAVPEIVTECGPMKKVLQGIKILQQKCSGVKEQLVESTALLKAQVKKTKTLSRTVKNSRRLSARMKTKHATDLDDVNKENIELQNETERQAESIAEATYNTVALTNKITQVQLAETRLKKQNRALKAKVSRSRTSKLRAIAELKLTRTSRNREKFHLKRNGVVSDASRALIRDLVKIGLSVSHVSATIKAVANLLEVEVEGDVGERTVGRIVVEGGIAAKMQVVDEIKHSDNVTISGDGTTLRNLNYEAKHLNFKTRLYEDDAEVIDSATHVPGQRVTRSLGLMSSKDHTAATQVHGWKDINQEMHDIYNESPRGVENHINPAEAPSKLTGYHGDHAADQKKAAGLIKDWMVESDRIVRGEAAISTWSSENLLALIMQETQKKIDNAGGLDAFNDLPIEEQDLLNATTFTAVCFIIGEAAYDALSEAEQRAANLFIWAGCCMHKELNAVKGGDKALSEFWTNRDLVPPIQLMNKDNDAAAAAGPSHARDRAIKLSTGGATKLTSLAGAIFNHKDAKKGQGDTFVIFFERKLGYIISFPDTSNTRYQSHCEASAALLVHLPLYLKFLEQVRDKKEKRQFNHMEQNVYKGLQDIPTLTELAVLTLYGQSISHPYLREIRGADCEHDNILDTGPLHERVKAHCRAIIANPDLLLSLSTSSETGSMDGKGWDQPDAVYAVHAMSDRLPHLREALVAFFTGALETWERFTSEFREGGLVSNSTELERERAWMKKANDDNEGALGELRVGSRRAPNMALHQRNARTMYKRNGTHLYISNILTKADLKFLRRKARRLDSSQIERKQRQAQARGDQDIVVGKRAKDQHRAARKQRVDDLLNRVECRFDTAIIVNSPGTNTQLDLELQWFRRLDAEVPIKARLGTKTLKIAALCAAVERYNRGQLMGDVAIDSDSSSSDSEHDSDVDSDADMELEY